MLNLASPLLVNDSFEDPIVIPSPVNQLTCLTCLMFQTGIFETTGHNLFGMCLMCVKFWVKHIFAIINRVKEHKATKLHVCQKRISRWSHSVFPSRPDSFGIGSVFSSKDTKRKNTKTLPSTTFCYLEAVSWTEGKTKTSRTAGDLRHNTWRNTKTSPLFSTGANKGQQWRC